MFSQGRKYWSRDGTVQLSEGPAGDEWQEGISKQEDLAWESTGGKQGQSRAVLTQGAMLLESQHQIGTE